MALSPFGNNNPYVDHNLANATAPTANLTSFSPSTVTQAQLDAQTDPVLRRQMLYNPLYDVNKDNLIDTADARQYLLLSRGINPIPEGMTAQSLDYNGDGILDEVDARGVLQLARGMPQLSYLDSLNATQPAAPVANATAANMMQTYNQTATPTAASGLLLGDADNDGKVTEADARLVLTAARQYSNSTMPEGYAAYDMNGDGRIDTADARQVLLAARRAAEAQNAVARDATPSTDQGYFTPATSSTNQGYFTPAADTGSVALGPTGTTSVLDPSLNNPMPISDIPASMTPEMVTAEQLVAENAGRVAAPQPGSIQYDSMGQPIDRISIVPPAPDISLGLPQDYLAPRYTDPNNAFTIGPAPTFDMLSAAQAYDQMFGTGTTATPGTGTGTGTTGNTTGGATGESPFGDYFKNFVDTVNSSGGQVTSNEGQGTLVTNTGTGSVGGDGPTDTITDNYWARMEQALIDEGVDPEEAKARVFEVQGLQNARINSFLTGLWETYKNLPGVFSIVKAVIDHFNNMGSNITSWFTPEGENIFDMESEVMNPTAGIDMEVGDPNALGPGSTDPLGDFINDLGIDDPLGDFIGATPGINTNPATSSPVTGGNVTGQDLGYLSDSDPTAGIDMEAGDPNAGDPTAGIDMEAGDPNAVDIVDTPLSAPAVASNTIPDQTTVTAPTRSLGGGGSDSGSVSVDNSGIDATQADLGDPEGAQAAATTSAPAAAPSNDSSSNDSSSPSDGGGGFDFGGGWGGIDGGGGYWAEGGEVNADEVAEKLRKYDDQIKVMKERASLVQSDEPIDPYRLAEFLTQYRNKGITDPESARQLLDAMKAGGSLPEISIEDIQFPQYREGEDKVFIPIDRPDIPNVHGNYSHELFHALAKRAKDEAGKYAFPSLGFFTADEEDRRYRDNIAKFFESVDKSKLGDVDPEVPKWLEEYRTNPNEMMGFGMAHTSQPRSKLTDVGGMLNPHVDPSMGTQARMLMEMYQRQMERKNPRGKGDGVAVKNFADGGEVAADDPEAALIEGARMDAIQPDDLSFLQFVAKYPLAAAEVGTTVASSLPAAIAGPLYGMYKQIEAGELGQQTGTGEKASAELMQKMTYQPKSEAAQNFMRLFGKAMDVAKVPAMMPEAMPLAYMSTQPGMARRALADFQEYNQRLNAAGVPVPGASYAVRPQMPVPLIDAQGNPVRDIPITPITEGKKGLKQYVTEDEDGYGIRKLFVDSSYWRKTNAPKADRWVLRGVDTALDFPYPRGEEKAAADKILAAQNWWLTTGYNYATQRAGTVADPLRSLIAGGNIATKATKENILSPAQMQSLGPIRTRPLKDKDGNVQLDEKGEPIRVDVKTGYGAPAYKYPEEWDIFVSRFDKNMYPNSSLYLLDKDSTHWTGRNTVNEGGRQYRDSIESAVSEQYAKEKGVEGESESLRVNLIPEPKFETVNGKILGDGLDYTPDQIREFVNLEQTLITGLKNPELDQDVAKILKFNNRPTYKRGDKESDRNRRRVASTIAWDIYKAKHESVEERLGLPNTLEQDLADKVEQLSILTGINKEVLRNASTEGYSALHSMLAQKGDFDKLEIPFEFGVVLGVAEDAPPVVLKAILKNLIEQNSPKTTLESGIKAYAVPEWLHESLKQTSSGREFVKNMDVYEQADGGRQLLIPEAAFRDVPKSVSAGLANEELLFHPGVSPAIDKHVTGPAKGLDPIKINEYLATKRTPEEIKNTSIDEAIQGSYAMVAKEEVSKEVIDAIKKNKKVKPQVFDSGMTTLKTYGEEVGEQNAGKRWERFDEPEQTELDGAFLGQCIGGYCNPAGRESIKKGDTILYRLRDKRGYPLTNMEVKVRTDSEGNRSVTVTQIKSDGRKTGNVAAKSSDAVIYDFLRNILPTEFGIPAGVIQYVDDNLRATTIKLTESLSPGVLTSAYKSQTQGIQPKDGMVYAYDIDMPNGKLVDRNYPSTRNNLAKGGMVERSDTSGRRYL